MLSELLQHACSIYATETILSGGEQTKTETLLYENIKCMFYKKKQYPLPETGLAQETDTSSYSVIVEGDKKDIQNGNIIYITDARGQNM